MLSEVGEKELKSGKKADIEQVLKDITKLHTNDIEAVYAPDAFGDKGLIRFKTVEAKQKYFTDCDKKPKLKGKEYTISNDWTLENGSTPKSFNFGENNTFSPFRFVIIL